MGNVFTKEERSEYYTKRTCIAKGIYDILAEERCSDGWEDLIRSCESPKMQLLWEIFFDTGMDELALLEERVYQYGSMVKEQDVLSREIFLGMVTLLGQMKKLQLDNN